MARASSEAHRRFVRNLGRLLPLTSALFVSPALAVKWEIDPTLSVEEQFTDNVSLAPDESKRSEWATIVTPGLGFNVTGRDWRLVGNYGAQTVHLARAERTKVNHQLRLNSIGSIELYPKLLYLDTRGGISQVNFSSLAQQAADNVNTTGNRATVRTVVMSPYLRYAFGPDATALARYTYSTVNSDTGGLSNSTSNRVEVGLSSGAAYKLTTWNAQYSKEVIDYSSGQQENSLARLQVGVTRLITPSIGLLARVGYEENDYATVGEAPKGGWWNLGVNWNPTPRTSFSAFTGRRYFGTTHGLDFNHRMRALTFSAGYSEEITSTRSQLTLPSSASTADYLDSLFLAQYPDPLLRQQAVQTFITQNGLPPTLSVPVDFFTNQFFLSKSWRASVGFRGIRHSVVGNFFSSVRESQQAGVPVAGGGGDFTSSSEVKQTGTSATWSWRFNQSDTSNVTVGYTQTEHPSIPQKTNLTYARWIVGHRFSKDLSGGLSYRWVNSDSSVAGPPSNYSENAVSASLRMSF